MSAFIVTDKVLDHAVYAMVHDPNNYSKLSVSCCEEADRIGQRMYELNILAVNERYREDNQPIDEHYRYRGRSCSWVQALKSLECLIYQCNEGRASESGLFSEMERKADSIRRYIIRQLPEYEAAAWG